ncbi:MAG: ribonuclease D [Maritimibacter sp.]
MANHLYKGDLPDGLDLGPVVAIDTETMGLNPHRDRLCVVQLSSGDGNAHIIQIAKDQSEAPNLVKMLLDEMLHVDVSKQQQQTDWGADELTEAQLDYAASDVLYLHRLKEKLDARLAREGRVEVAQACFDFLPMRAKLDLIGWPETDIFAH